MHLLEVLGTLRGNVAKSVSFPGETFGATAEVSRFPDIEVQTGCMNKLGSQTRMATKRRVVRSSCLTR